MKAFIIITYLLANNPTVLMKETKLHKTRIVCEIEEGTLNNDVLWRLNPDEPVQVVNKFGVDVAFVSAECHDLTLEQQEFINAIQDMVFN